MRYRRSDRGQRIDGEIIKEAWSRVLCVPGVRYRRFLIERRRTCVRVCVCEGVDRWTIGRRCLGPLAAVREGICRHPDVGNCMTERRRRKIRDKHSRQPQEPRFNINADGAPLPALITLHCASLAPSVIYIRPRYRVMHIPVRISNVSVPTEAGTWTIHADGGGRERDRRI